MTPQEISQLKQQSPALQEALASHRADVWQVLRESVIMYLHYTNETTVDVMTVIGPMMRVIPHTAPCGKCEKPVPHDMLLASPYNSSYRPGDFCYMMPNNGWCIDCVLNAFFDPDTPLYRSPEEIEEQHRLDNPVICEVFDFDEAEPEGGWIIPPIG